MTRRGASEVGVLLVDKPPGPTSHEIVGWIRWALRVKQVGHCGTLDPAASGLLVVCVGPATRLVPYLTAAEKAYEAQITLGRATDTADGQGKTVAEATVPHAALDRAAAVVAALVGDHMLPPPAFSAVKVDGKRAHERARAGDEVELAARPMGVRQVDGVDVDREQARIRCRLVVTKGTYVRSLAVRVGEQLGVPAHLSELRRTASGGLDVGADDVVGPLTAAPLPPDRSGAPRWRVRPAGLEDADREGQAAWLRARLRAPDRVLPFPGLALEEAPFRRLGHGQEVEAPGLPAGVERVAVRCETAAGLLICRVTGAEHLKAERTILAVEPRAQAQAPEIPGDPPA